MSNTELLVYGDDVFLYVAQVVVAQVGKSIDTVEERDIYILD